MKAPRDHWANKLPEWYAAAVAAVRRDRPTFEPMRFEQVRWQVTGRASRKAGVCWSSQKRIWLHAAMTEEQALSTFRHELAHLWVYWYENTSAQPWERNYNHGPQWRYWARMLGDNGDRCHNYAEVLATRRGTWAHCANCGWEQKKTWRAGSCSYYHHKRCGQIRGIMKPGRATSATPVKLADALVKVRAANPAACEPSRAPEDRGAEIRGLVLELGILRDGGQASSSAARKIRQQLRSLGHQGGAREI